jgi:hypothetical protein
MKRQARMKKKHSHKMTHAGRNISDFMNEKMA